MVGRDGQRQAGHRRQVIRSMRNGSGGNGAKLTVKQWRSLTAHHKPHTRTHTKRMTSLCICLSTYSTHYVLFVNQDAKCCRSPNKFDTLYDRFAKSSLKNLKIENPLNLNPEH